MPVYLPKNLAPLVSLTARDLTRCPAVVHVLDLDGTYRVEVTDGRRLAIVQGPCLRESYSALDAVPNGDSDIFLPVEDWKSAFRLGGKASPVGLAADGDRFTLAVGDRAVTGLVPEVRFPNVDTVLPREPALLSVAFDPALLTGLLQAAAALDPVGGMSLLYFGPGKPLGLIAHNDQGQYFDALLMPLS